LSSDAGPAAATQHVIVSNDDKGPPPRSSARFFGQRATALVVGSIGVVGLGVGGVLGILSLSNHTDCGGHCTGPDRDRQSNAYVYGNASTIAFGVGLAALAVATVLWFTAPKATSASATR